MDLTIPSINLVALAPEIILIVTALGLLVVDAVVGGRRTAALLSLAGIGAALLATFFLWLQPDANVQGMIVSDDFARWVKLIILLAAGLSVLMSFDYILRVSEYETEYYVLILLASVGMMVMGAASDLLTVFLGLEIFSVGLYVLAGFNREDLRSAEAALKYFLLGAFASAFFLYGVALTYGATGTTNLLAMAARTDLAAGPLLLAGLGLLTVGFAFKVALVPFQQWTPDVYQGALTPVTAFMSVGAKTAGFAAFARVLMALLPAEYWAWPLAILAVLTMTVGNLSALRQSSLKRMLAYSSIAHAGYAVLGLVAGTAAGVQALFYYLFVYGFMNLGAFAVLTAVERQGEGDVTWDELRGLAGRHPGMTAAMVLFMLSLAGIPPLAGFFGKLYLFSAVVETGWVWLAAIAMLNSVVSAYYYLRVIVTMFSSEPETAVGLPMAGDGWNIRLALVVAAVGTVVIGVASSPLLNLLAQTGARLVAGG